MVQVLILAGGKGSRLGMPARPKALATIGGHSMLWHVIEGFRRQGYGDALIALGHQGDQVRAALPAEYPGYAVEVSSAMVELNGGGRHGGRIRLLDTGAETPVPARIERALPHLARQAFFLNWTDVFADVDYQALLAAHRRAARLMTLAAVRPPARYGRVDIDGSGRVRGFSEKRRAVEGRVFGGIAVAQPDIADYLREADDSFEDGAVQRMIAEGVLGAFEHDGFWQSVDYPYEREYLEHLWRAGRTPWRHADVPDRAVVGA